MSDYIEGLDKTLKNINKMFAKSPLAAQTALIKVSNHILAEAVQDCPVDQGTLRRSGKVDEIDFSLIESSVRIVFDVDYAVYVHENLQAHHPVGHAKFLENAVSSIAPELVTEVATGYRSEFNL